MIFYVSILKHFSSKNDRDINARLGANKMFRFNDIHDVVLNDY